MHTNIKRVRCGRVLRLTCSTPPLGWCQTMGSGAGRKNTVRDWSECGVPHSRHEIGSVMSKARMTVRRDERVRNAGKQGLGRSLAQRPENAPMRIRCWCITSDVHAWVSRSAPFKTRGIRLTETRPSATSSCTQRCFTARCRNLPTPTRWRMPRAALLSLRLSTAKSQRHSRHT